MTDVADGTTGETRGEATAAAAAAAYLIAGREVGGLVLDLLDDEDRPLLRADDMG